MPAITLRLKNPITKLDGTGVDVSPNSPIFGLRPEVTVISIGQAVSTSSNVTFNQITNTSSSFVIDNSSLLLKENNITGSFSQSGDISVNNDLILNGDLVVDGTMTAEQVKTSHSQSFTLFTSGSSKFGDNTTDIQNITGSLFSSGSIKINNYQVQGISNDSTFSGSSATKLVTENSVISKYSQQNIYLRKISANIANVDSVNTASFNAVTASAPAGMTSTNENDFMFFCNGMIMEHDALEIEQSGSKLLLKINVNNIGYEFQSIALGAPTTDEIVGWGKFN